MIYNYNDAYLTKRMTFEREQQAIDDVARYGVTDSYWLEQLTVYRAYVIACVEDMSSPDDTYSAKLKHYQKEFDKALGEAKASKETIDTGVTASLWSTQIGRN
jgi:hypothetical protein